MGQAPGLLEYLRKQLPTIDHHDTDTVRFYDVVGIESSSRFFTAALTNGQTIVYSFPWSSLEKSPLFSWFVRTNRRYYINMLNADILRTTYQQIVLQKEIKDMWEEKLGAEQLDGILTVSRHQQKYAKIFLRNMHQLEDWGWERTLIDEMK